MTIVPSLALIGLNAMVALVGAIVLRKRWMRRFALGCAVFEIAALTALIVLTK